MPDELYTAQSKPNVIYLHIDEHMMPLYVGCTSDPSRPNLKAGRPWMKSGELYEVIVSPEMPYEAAAWVEDLLIRRLRPKYNKRSGRHIDTDPRVRQIADVAKVSHSRAVAMRDRWRKLNDNDFERELNDYATTIALIKQQRGEFQTATKGMTDEEKDAFVNARIAKAWESLPPLDQLMDAALAKAGA